MGLALLKDQSAVKTGRHDKALTGQSGSCTAAFPVYFSRSQMKTLALFVFSTAASIQAQDYALGPESQPQTGVPKGTVTKFTLDPGKFYPGTPHNCSLYVPAQYDAAK